MYTMCLGYIYSLIASFYSLQNPPPYITSPCQLHVPFLSVSHTHMDVESFLGAWETYHWSQLQRKFTLLSPAVISCQ